MTVVASSFSTRIASRRTWFVSFQGTRMRIVEVGQDGSGMWRVVTGWVAEKPEEDWYAENIGGATGGEKEEQ